MSALLRPRSAERVPQSEVVRHWLRSECEAAAAGRRTGPVVRSGADDALPAPGRVDSLSGSEALDLLLRSKPGAAGFLARDESVAWYRTAVGADGFRRLRLVESPAGTLWRALAPDRSPVTAARAVADGDPDVLAAETGVDVRRIRRICAALDAGAAPAPPLVVRTRRGRVPWTVVDGNHRAVARATGLVDVGAPGLDGAPGHAGATDGVGGSEAGETVVDAGSRGTGEADHGAGSDAGEFAPQPVYLGVRPNPVVRPLRERVGGVVCRLLDRGVCPP